MNFFSKLAATTALAATLATGALPASARSNPHHHIALLEATRAEGINVEVNPAECFEGDDVLGFYQGRLRRIVICQLGRVSYVGEVADFSEKDFDTFRHEVQHFIQDCMVQNDHDHVLGPVYQEPVDMALEVLGREHAERIVQVYKENGASDLVLVLELEAFAVAALNDPIEQVRDIKKYCSGY